jgi:peptidoglycan/LPS O-acetylase OafA/YrhL
VLVFLGFTWGCRAVGKPQWLSSPHALEMIPPESLNAWQWLGNVTLTETWRPHVGGGPWNIFTRVAWSLCYEEQFYFVCFLGLLLARRRLFGWLLGVTAVSGLVLAVSLDIGAFRHIEGTFPQLWHEFAAGVAVYYRLNRAMTAGARRGIEVGLVGLALLGFVTPADVTPVRFSTTVTAVFALLLIALRSRDERMYGAPLLRPLRECGRRCYSIYLVHLPVCTAGCTMLVEAGWTGFWARALGVVPVVSVAAVGFSFGYFHVVERHFLNPPLRPRAGGPGSGGGCGAAAAAGAMHASTG